MLFRSKYEGQLSYGIDAYPAALGRVRRACDVDKLAVLRQELVAATEARWQEIAEAMAPPLRKYGG